MNHDGEPQLFGFAPQRTRPFVLRMEVLVGWTDFDPLQSHRHPSLDFLLDIITRWINAHETDHFLRMGARIFGDELIRHVNTCVRGAQPEDNAAINTCHRLPVFLRSRVKINGTFAYPRGIREERCMEMFVLPPQMGMTINQHH